MRQKNQIKKFKSREHWMKWIIAVAFILIMLLVLLLGYATDWTRGLRKAAVSNPSAILVDNPDAPENEPAIGDIQSNGTNSELTRESLHSSSSERATTTGTNNNSTGTDISQPTNDLLELYENTSPGGDINDTINQSNQQGISSSCQNDLIIQTCSFNQAGQTVNTKNLMGTGFITSVSKSF